MSEDGPNPPEGGNDEEKKRGRGRLGRLLRVGATAAVVGAAMWTSHRLERRRNRNGRRRRRNLIRDGLVFMEATRAVGAIGSFVEDNLNSLFSFFRPRRRSQPSQPAHRDPVVKLPGEMPESSEPLFDGSPTTRRPRPPSHPPPRRSTGPRTGSSSGGGAREGVGTGAGGQTQQQPHPEDEALLDSWVVGGDLPDVPDWFDANRDEVGWNRRPGGGLDPDARGLPSVKALNDLFVHHVFQLDQGDSRGGGGGGGGSGSGSSGLKSAGGQLRSLGLDSGDSGQGTAPTSSSERKSGERKRGVEGEGGRARWIVSQLKRQGAEEATQIHQRTRDTLRVLFRFADMRTGDYAEGKSQNGKSHGGERGEGKAGFALQGWVALYVFSFLDLPSVMRASLTCKSWNKHLRTLLHHHGFISSAGAGVRGFDTGPMSVGLGTVESVPRDPFVLANHGAMTPHDASQEDASSRTSDRHSQAQDIAPASYPRRPTSRGFAWWVAVGSRSVVRITDPKQLRVDFSWVRRVRGPLDLRSIWRFSTESNLRTVIPGSSGDSGDGLRAPQTPHVQQPVLPTDRSGDDFEEKKESPPHPSVPGGPVVPGGPATQDESAPSGGAAPSSEPTSTQQQGGSEGDNDGDGDSVGGDSSGVDGGGSGSHSVVVFERHDTPLNALRRSRFEQLLSTHTRAAPDIRKDTHRTLIHYDAYGGDRVAAQRDLYALLHAYAVSDPEVGYVQGMNFLGAHLLMQMPVAQAFWVMRVIMHGQKYGPLREFFLPTLPGLIRFQQRFDLLFSYYIPDLYEHFADCSVNTSIYCTQWFMTVFSCSNLPPETVARIWDAFIVEGEVAMYRFGLAILEALRPTLLRSNMEQIVQQLRRGREVGELQSAVVLRLARGFWITRDILLRIDELLERK